MSNVLSDDKRQQIIALGRLDWSLRRIEQATGVRRETTSAYLKAAGISVRPPGRWGCAAKPAIQVTTDSNLQKSTNPGLNNAEVSKAAICVFRRIVSTIPVDREQRSSPWEPILVPVVVRNNPCMT